MLSLILQDFFVEITVREDKVDFLKHLLKFDKTEKTDASEF